jgi:hypothetical protein
MNRTYSAFSLVFFASFSGLGCGGGDDPQTEPTSCDFAAQSGCKDDLVCEQTDDGKTGCFAPVMVEGRVVSAADVTHGIAGARVVARDENGAVTSLGIAVSKEDGGYSLRVPAVRKSDGTPAVPDVLLRADAASFATFPGGLRVAIPVDVSAPKLEQGAYRVVNDSTTIALDALAETDLGSVAGKVLVEGAQGTLVVAGANSAIADRDGSYVIFNVPAGEHEVRGYRAGLSLEGAQAAVEAGSQTEDVNLAGSDAPLGSVNGSVAFVNASAQTTSVVLVVASTFNASLARGEVPQGLRAFPVSGSYSFENVPAGDYVVLAAFENDELVRDPDTAIGGTAIQNISVAGANVDVTGFKITGALQVLAPGANGPESMPGDVTFQWLDDSSEDGYELTVLDTFGNEIWKDSDVPRVTGADVSVPYAGPALTPGYYQFRAVSWRTQKNGGAARTYISATEDLKGVFVIP